MHLHLLFISVLFIKIEIVREILETRAEVYRATGEKVASDEEPTASPLPVVSSAVLRPGQSRGTHTHTPPQIFELVIVCECVWWGGGEFTNPVKLMVIYGIDNN